MRQEQLPSNSICHLNWVAHAQFLNVSSCVQTAVERLFEQDKPYSAAWLQLYDSDVDCDSSNSSSYNFSPSQHDATPPHSPIRDYAAPCGFNYLVERLIAKYPQQAKATGGCYMTPASAALARRHFEIARLLNRNGSSVDLLGYCGNTPLHSAVIYGDRETVLVSLKCKADVNLGMELARLH